MLHSVLHNMRRGIAVMIIVMLASLSAAAQIATEDTLQPPEKVESIEVQVQEAPELELSPNSDIDSVSYTHLTLPTILLV